MQNILILGVCGFIGTFLRESLQPEYNVIGYDRVNPADVPDNGNFKYICGDFTNENFYKILQDYDIDTIFHLIASTVPSEDTSQIEKEILNDIYPTIKLLRDMVKAGVKKLIFASSGGTIYGQSHGYAHKTDDALHPICSHGVQKATIERYLSIYNLYHNLSCISARIGNPYGLWIEKNRTQGIVPILVCNLFDDNQITLYGDTLRDYIHIDDVINALGRLIAYSGEKEVFNIGTGTSHRLSEIVDIIEKKAGRKFKDIIHREIRLCDVEESALDISETIAELGWAPQYSLHEGIEEIVRYYLEKTTNI